jgi:pimeloyl-ACP methyl ester carboxylesterase
MEPLFFGSSSSSLYGVYHAPDQSVFGSKAVVLCYPGGHEYMRIHRAYRQLASSLNRLGYHVLRFDYFGVGDSAGEHDEHTMERWNADLKHAVEELRSLSGAKQVDLIGLRLGSLVAAQEASTNKSVRRLVLWEPMLSGQVFVDEMLAHMNRFGVSESNFFDDSGNLHFHGYNFSSSTLESIKNLQLDKFQWSNKPKVMTLSASDNSLTSPIKAYCEGQFDNCDHLYVDGLKNWNLLDAIGGLFLPMDSVNAIVNWMSEN